MLNHSKWLTAPLAMLTILTMHSGVDAGDRIALTGHLSQKESLTIPAAPSFELIDLEMPDEALPEQFSMSIKINGQDHQIEVNRYSLRGPDFKLLVDDGLQLNEVTPTEARTYKGSVQGREGSAVRASLLDTGLHALINLGDDEGTWFVQPLASFEDADQMARSIEGASEKTQSFAELTYSTLRDFPASTPLCWVWNPTYMGSNPEAFILWLLISSSEYSPLFSESRFNERVPSTSPSALVVLIPPLLCTQTNEEIDSKLSLNGS